MIEIQHLNKTFRLKNNTVEAVRDISLMIGDGAIYGIIGYSGAGKSTLVRCMNLLEIPDSGHISMSGFGEITVREGKLSWLQPGKTSPQPLSEKQLCRFRRGTGMIFQHFNLLDRSTVYENIAYPLRYCGLQAGEIRRRVCELLALVDLEDKTNVYPSQLSGGQRQRVAIARALAGKPAVLLSDEATSALDPEATESILNLLKDLNRKLGLTIVMITHEMAVIKSVCQRVAVMENGAVVEEGDLYDLFSAPQKPITRKFVNASSPLGKIDKLIASGSPLIQTQGHARLVRLLFRKDSVGDSVISNVSRQFNVNLNIVLANVEVLGENPLGGMIAVIDGTEDDIARALAYLNETHVVTEVLEVGTVA